MNFTSIEDDTGGSDFVARMVGRPSRDPRLEKIRRDQVVTLRKVFFGPRPRGTVSDGLVAGSFYLQSFEGVPIFLFVYIAFFALSQGAVIWVFISEIFPNEVRASGQSLGSFTHWLLAAIVANVFPYFANTFGGDPVFLFFTIMMVVQLIFVWKIMPETKGKSLEELEKELGVKSMEV